MSLLKALVNTSLPPLCYTKEEGSFSHAGYVFPYPAASNLPTLASATTQPALSPQTQLLEGGMGG